MASEALDSAAGAPSALGLAMSPARRSAVFAAAAASGGASVLAIAVWILAQGGHATAAAGAALGGGTGLVLGAFVFQGWVAALRQGGDRLWRAFGRGFALKALALVAGTVLLHFFVPAADSQAFAVSFALAILWITVLGVLFLHRRLRSSRGL